MGLGDNVDGMRIPSVALLVAAAATHRARLNIIAPQHNRTGAARICGSGAHCGRIRESLPQGFGARRSRPLRFQYLVELTVKLRAKLLPEVHKPVSHPREFIYSLIESPLTRTLET
jgi:hypothetical protein